LPRKRLTLRKIREVLRLKAAGLNIQEVAEGAWSARTTVYEYLVRAEGAGLSWPLPEDSYRACLGLMALAKRYRNERLGAACQGALASGAISYTSVKSILAQNLDRAPLPAASPAPAPAEHENLRGAGYYAGTEKGA
jgi:hypothetical protein